MHHGIDRNIYNAIYRESGHIPFHRTCVLNETMPGSEDQQSDGEKMSTQMMREQMQKSMESVQEMRAMMIAQNERNEKYRHRLQTLMQQRETALCNKQKEAEIRMKLLTLENKELKSMVQTLQRDSINSLFKNQSTLSVKNHDQDLHQCKRSLPDNREGDMISESYVARLEEELQTSWNTVEEMKKRLDAAHHISRELHHELDVVCSEDFTSPKRANAAMQAKQVKKSKTKDLLFNSRKLSGEFSDRHSKPKCKVKFKRTNKKGNSMNSMKRDIDESVKQKSIRVPKHHLKQSKEISKKTKKKSLEKRTKRRRKMSFNSHTLRIRNCSISTVQDTRKWQIRPTVRRVHHSASFAKA